MRNYRPAKRRIEVSPGESLRIVRELQELSQNELARRTGIPQATLSAIENSRIRLGVEEPKFWPAPCAVTPPSWFSLAGTLPRNPPPKPVVILDVFLGQAGRPGHRALDSSQHVSGTHGLTE